MPLKNLQVIKRNGRIEKLDITKIHKYTSTATEGVTGVSQSELEVDARIQFRDNITTSEIQQTLIQTAVSKIDIDKPNWTFVAARLFLYDLYHRVNHYTGYFHIKDYFEKAEKNHRVVKGLKDKYDLEDLNSYIDSKRDLQFTYLGIKTLYDRYLIKDRKGNPIELPQHMFMAIAMFLAQNEENPQYWAKKFYDLISKFEVMVATPTLSNARTPRHQLSSCYVGTTPDNIEGIFDSFKEMALLSKYGGGIGWDWSRVRGLGSFIDGHKNAAGGVIPWLRITNDIAIAVDQLGTRKGAIAVYLEPWHSDISEFLDLKKNSGEERRRTHDLFPALWIPDLFMKRVEADGFWTLFDPFETQDLTDCFGEEFERKYEAYEKDETLAKEVIKAKDLWRKILVSYFETGNPFLCFKDNANRANPNGHDGIIRSSNLCVSGDTRIATSLGLVRADELEKMNRKIITSYDYRTNGDYKKFGVGVAPSLKMFKTKENAEIYEVVTKDGYSIKSTLWHEYYVVDGKNRVIKKSLKNIKKDEKLLIQSSIGQFGLEGDFDLGFIIGLITGDGTFSQKENGYSTAYIDLYNSDIKLSKLVHSQIENIINNYYAMLPKAYKKEFKNKFPKEIKHTKNSKKVRFTNLRLGRVLDEQFNFNKDTKYRVPEIVFKGTKECVVGYLKALFIADGTVNIIKNNKVPTFAIQLASKEKNLLKDVQLLLSNFGIRSKISKMRDKGNKHFQYITKDGEKKEYISSNLFRLNINGENAINFINSIGFFGDKQVKALNVFKRREELGYSAKSRKKEYFLSDIESIKFVGVEDVYDTTQLYNNSLIFNGIVTGNCTEIYQNTHSNRYLMKIEFSDGEVKTYEESDIVKTDQGVEKEAKKITALDFIDGKQVYFVEKTNIDGQTAVCNLASINLSKINKKEDFERVVPIAVRMLDNVIDLNFYPVKKTKETNLKTRAIGLGVMGEAQFLAENRIKWGSDEHLKKVDEMMEAVSFNAIKASCNLAKEKGKYGLFENSNWSKGIFPIDVAKEQSKELLDRDYVYDWDSLREDVKTSGVRNGYMMAIAPTSSISILAGTTQTIEPVYKRKWYEENLSGLIPVIVPNLSPETWEYYSPSYELNQIDLVRACAIRQKWIDQGQSLNIFISLDKASAKYLNDIYMNAWKLGLKGTYYLRSQSPEASGDVMSRDIECDSCQ